MFDYMKQYLMIGVGGIIGATGRYSISLLLHNNQNEFPFATLTVNLIGCFLLTYFLNHPKIKQTLSSEIFIALSVGVIGSFTTLSAVTIEVMNLYKINLLLAITYLIASIFGGLICCFCGYKIATMKLGEHVK